MKTIIPLKLIIDLDENGSYKNAVLVYNVRYESGTVSNKTYTISINTKINIPSMNTLLDEGKTFAQEQEQKTKQEE